MLNFLDIALNFICDFLWTMNILFSKTLSHKIARYLLFNKQVNRSKHIFYNNKLLLKATLVKLLFTQLILEPIFFLFRRNVLSFTKRTCLINVKQ